jgi:hypothetical protein
MTGYIEGGMIETRDADWYRACPPMANFDEAQLDRIEATRVDWLRAAARIMQLPPGTAAGAELQHVAMSDAVMLDEVMRLLAGAW